MVSAVTVDAAAGKMASSGATLATNFETFLSLLTTQLKNQDPLSPMDSNEFTAQLTQMTGVEQQLLTNQLLTSLLEAQQGDPLTAAASYIGKEATAVWSATTFKDGEAKWSYELAADAASVKLDVLDSAGKTVWTGTADANSRAAGINDFVWTGGQDGKVYTLKVTAQNAYGQNLDNQVMARGRITGVEMYNGAAYATIGGSIVPLSVILALDEKVEKTTTPDPAPTPTPTPTDPSDQETSDPDIDETNA